MGKIAEFIGHFAQGPALAMLLLVLICRLRTREAFPDVRFLDFVLAGALVAAWLPTPSWQPYLAPILPPLALQFALCVPRLARWSAVLVPFALYGMVGTIVTAAEARRFGSPVLAKQREAHWLGTQLRACKVKGPVASFTARRVIDSGYELDRRFAPGVFVFRSGRIAPPEEARRLNVAVPTTLAEEFDRDPPGAILVGDQMGSVLFRLRPDLPLVRYAEERRWGRIDHPEGRMAVYLNPQLSRARCTHQA